MRCTIAGLIPLMSFIVHLIASLCFLKIDIKLSSYFSVKWDAMMTDSVSLPPRLAYLSCSEKAFNSKEGVNSLEGRIEILVLRLGTLGLDA